MKQLEHWLDTQDPRMARAVATRASLRSLPVLMPLVGEQVAEVSGATVLLAGLRTALVAGVYCTCDVEDLKRIGAATAEATRYAANSTRFLSRLLRGEAGAPGAASALNAAEKAASLGQVDKADALATVRHGADAAAALTFAHWQASGKPAGDEPEDAPRTPFVAAAIGESGLETVSDPQSLFMHPLWFDGLASPECDAAYQSFVDGFATDPVWSFWITWYAALRRGQPMDWSLQTEIALIEPDCWDAGAAAVAERISEIQAQFEPDAPMSEPASRRQAGCLLRSAEACETSARGLQALIQMALDAYLREISNALPDALEPLDRLPVILDGIANVLSDDPALSDREQDLAGLIATMAQVVATLNHRLCAAQTELAMAHQAAEADRPGRLFADAFYSKAGEGAAALITSKVLWGGLISGSALLLGADAEALTKGLGDCFQSIVLPEAPDALQITPNALPSTTYDV